jgi:TRAP-type C4-dicarboxylate transport system substrate-binding protein
MRKLGFRMALAVFLGVFIIGATGTVSVAAETVTLKALTAWPENAFESQEFLKFVTDVQKAADEKYPGELKIDYRGGGEVIQNREQVEALRKGLIEMVYTAGSYYTSVIPEIDIMSLTDMTPWEERAAGVNDYLETIHNKKANAHMLGRTGTGSKFHMFLADPIKTVDDLKGRKLRVSPTNIPFMKTIGVVPIGMPPPEVYTAMERGVVNGYILPPGTIRDFGLIPVSKFMVVPGFYEPCQFVLVNLDAWKKLPPHLQELLTEKVQEFAKANIKAQHDKLDVEFADFKKQGMTFIELSPEESQKLLGLANKALFDTVSAKAPEEAKKIKEMITK